MKAIARGEYYPEAPPPFPHAEVVVRDSTKILTHLIGTRNANFIAEKRGISFYAIPIILGGSLAGMVAMEPSIAKISAAMMLFFLALFYQYTHQKPAPNSIYLSPRFTAVYPPITYGTHIDAIVNNAPGDSRLISDLDMAFRQYRLHVFNAPKLESFISQLVEQSMQPPDPPQPEGSLIDKAEALFSLHVPPSPQPTYNNVVYIIGPTGAGKTTVLNYLRGRKMAAVNPLFLRRVRRDGNEKVVIAENGIAEIGHQLGAGSSQTFVPQFVQDEDLNLVYCDCPGFNDNREYEKEICANLLVNNARKHSSIKGFLFCIEYGDIFNGRGGKCLEDFSLLDKFFLGSFDIHKKRVLFVITKAPPGTTLTSVRKALTELAKRSGKELSSFSHSLLSSKVLNTQLVICDPCSSAWGRYWFRRKIKNLDPFPYYSRLTYPLSMPVVRALDQRRLTIEAEIKDILASFEVTLNTYWAAKIAEGQTAEILKEYYWELYRLHFNSNHWISKYRELNPERFDHLEQRNKELEKISEFLLDHQIYFSFWKSSTQSLVAKVNELKKQAEKNYYTKTSTPISGESSGGCEVL